jgi:hypothetical protein
VWPNFYIGHYRYSLCMVVRFWYATKIRPGPLAAQIAQRPAKYADRCARKIRSFS